jgi:shikimate kinase
MEDYYSPHPTLSLSRPLALISFPGEEHRRAGHALASRTGLNFIDLDRWIEHEAGSTLKELVAAAGTAALRRQETEQLQRALRGRPHGVIALSQDLLMDPFNLDLVLSGTLLVVLQRNLQDAFGHWTRSLARRPPTHPSLPHPLASAEELAPWYEARQGGFRRAHHTLDLSRQTSGQVAAKLRSLVESLAS